MAIEKLSEFAKDGQKNTDDLTLTDGFPVSKKPARQWFNWLFNTLTLKINEIIEADYIRRNEIIDNLTTDDATKPVSAKQAKNLQDKKLGKTENAVSATKLHNPRTINNVEFNGEQDISIDAPLMFRGQINTLEGVDAAVLDGKYTVVDLSVAGLYGYGILVVIRSGGTCHQIYYPDTGNSPLMAMRQSWNVNGNTASWSAWGTIRTEDDSKLPLTGGTVSGDLGVGGTITVFNISDQIGAFKKLIQASTSTDSGYIAVGNNGTDKGYVEIGVTDDDDTDIYATQRHVTGEVIRRAVLLNGAGNTHFPETVYAKIFDGSLNGNSATATKLQTARIISFSGAATGSVNYDGSGNSSCILTLANSGVVANTYGSNLKIPTITVNAKGLITGVSEQQIPIVDDLTTGGSAKLLSAEQGKVLNNQAFGVGQAWVDVIASRAVSTVYTNSTGKPISVLIYVRGNSLSTDSLAVVVGGVSIIETMNIIEGDNTIVSFIVPNGLTYALNKLTTADLSLKTWAELR